MSKKIYSIGMSKYELSGFFLSQSLWVNLKIFTVTINITYLHSTLLQEKPNKTKQKNVM